MKINKSIIKPVNNKQKGVLTGFYISKSRDILLKSLLVNVKIIILYIVAAAFFL